MRSKLGKAVRKRFDEIFTKELPQFEPVTPGKICFDNTLIDEIPQGDRLYLWKYKDDLYLYVFLTIATPKFGDRFTVEIAWTKNQRYPLCAFCMFPYDIPESEIQHDIPINGDFRFRISELFENRSNEDFWWEVASQPTWEEFEKWNREGDFTGEKLFGPPETPLEEAMKNVESCVKDAVDKIIKYAMSYFQEIIQEYEANPNFWKEFDAIDWRQRKKEWMLKQKDGVKVSDEKCIWENCQNKVVMGSVYCIDHLIEHR